MPDTITIITGVVFKEDGTLSKTIETIKISGNK